MSPTVGLVVSNVQLSDIIS